MKSSAYNDNCGCRTATCSVKEEKQAGLWRYMAFLLPGLIIWAVLYRFLAPAAKWLTYSLFGLAPESHLASAVEFFFFDTPKVLMLLTLIVFGVGIIRSFFTPERTRQILAGKREFIGNALAGTLGIVTPFCSCSAVPLFIGFVSTGVPLGVTLSFLISAPMVNEIALVLLYGMFGWKVTVIYLSTGLTVAIISGWIIGRLGMENHVEEWVYETPLGMISGEEEKVTGAARIESGLAAVREIVSRVWPYVVAGIAVGAGIHGYIPEGLMAGIMGKQWWAVPASVLLGIPMYSNAAGIIPVVQALLGKGAGWERYWPS